MNRYSNNAVASSDLYGYRSQLQRLEVDLGKVYILFLIMSGSDNPFVSVLGKAWLFSRIGLATSKHFEKLSQKGSINPS